MQLLYWFTKAFKFLTEEAYMYLHRIFHMLNLQGLTKQIEDVLWLTLGRSRVKRTENALGYNFNHGSLKKEWDTLLII